MAAAISIKGVLIEDGSVVLLENERGEWELPGGRPEPGEDLAASLAREFAEELGAEVAVGGLVDCWNYEVLPGRHVMIVTYAVARAERGELRVSDEHRQLGWFPLDAIGALKLPDGYRRSIRAVAARPAIEPGWLTVARELQAMAQIGLHYTQDRFDADRYARLRVLASRDDGGGLERRGRADRRSVQPGCRLRHAAARRPRRGVSRRPHLDGARDDRRALGDARRLVRCQPDRRRDASSARSGRSPGSPRAPSKLAAVWDRARHGHLPLHPYSIFKMFFLCELTGGVATPSDETSEIGFFAEDALPELSPGRIQAHQIRRMFAHYRQPELPTDFD